MHIHYSCSVFKVVCGIGNVRFRYGLYYLVNSRGNFLLKNTHVTYYLKTGHSVFYHDAVKLANSLPTTLKYLNLCMPLQIFEKATYDGSTAAFALANNFSPFLVSLKISGIRNSKIYTGNPK